MPHANRLAPDQPDRSFALLTALVGAVGVILLIGSFVINPAPPPGASLPDILAFGRQRATSILVAGWLQGIGSVLNVVFALGVVQLAGASHTLAGRLVLLSGATLVCISLVECSLYFAAVDAGQQGAGAALLTTLTIQRGLQHVFLIAPALLLPLGWVLCSGRVLPRAFGASGLLLGGSLQALGLAGVLWPLQPLIDSLLIVQSVWFLAASLALAARALPSPRPRLRRLAEARA